MGTRYATDMAFLGRAVPMTYEIADLQPHISIEWVGHRRWVRTHDCITIRPHDGGTPIDYLTQCEYLVAPDFWTVSWQARSVGSATARATG